MNEPKKLHADASKPDDSPEASSGRGFLLPLVAAFFVMESLVNVGALIVFHDMVRDRLISRYVAAGHVAHEQLSSTADADFMMALIAAIIYAVVQLGLVFFSLRSRRLWVYVADFGWLAVLAVSGLSGIQGFHPGQGLQPDARIYLSFVLSAIAAMLAVLVLIVLVRRGDRFMRS